MIYDINNISIGTIHSNYRNTGDEGVFAFDDRLCCRPPYQREFVYDEAQQQKVIQTIQNSAPLGIMYWNLIPGEDGEYDTYEIIDGQQRTLSIMEYLEGKFKNLDGFYFYNLTRDQQEQILNYNLMICICKGTDSERQKWFETINVAGEKLTKQEIRNAVYVGPWLADAKRLFSKANCPAEQISSGYVSGTAIRQEILETALKWISASKSCTIEDYMAEHQRDITARPVFNYFQKVIEWAKKVFAGEPMKYMDSADWGSLYEKYSDKEYDAEANSIKADELLLDKEISKPVGIFEYILDPAHDHRALSLRTFDRRDMAKKYREQGGVCKICGQHFLLEDMQGDHIKPWSKGGRTEYNNLQMLCRVCNSQKSDCYPTKLFSDVKIAHRTQAAFDII